MFVVEMRRRELLNVRVLNQGDGVTDALNDYLH